MATKKKVLFNGNFEHLFKDLSETNHKFITEHAIEKEHKKGFILWQKGDVAEFCALITQGLIEIMSTNISGNDQVIGIFGPGEIIGLSALLKQSCYPANAVVASRICVIQKLYIRSAAAELDEKNKMNLIAWEKEMLLIHEQILRDKILILGAGHVNMRIVELFNHLILRFSANKDKNNKKYIIPIPLTKTQIARLIDARVETVIRILRAWETKGILSFTKDSIVIHQFDKLRDE